MIRIIGLSFSLVILAILGSCSNQANIERPLETWVVRINLDDRPRMVGLALNKNLYVAYDAQFGALYKAWKGDILFTGPVYDNIHGTQPISRGEAYIIDQLDTSPWSVMRNGDKISVTPDYKGYIRNRQQITLKYDLVLTSGETIKIEEIPEYVTSGDGRPGFERIFKTAGVPRGTDVLLSVSFEHLSNENDMESDGKWAESSWSDRSFDWGSSTTATGVLKLNPNGATRLLSYFEPKATAHIELQKTEETAEDPEEVSGDSESIDSEDAGILAMRGLKVIGQNDCAACHSVNKPIIGPSYVMIAQKYESTKEMIGRLSQKIMNGGAGVWGERAMSAHPNVLEADAKAMAAYILSVVPDDQVERQPGLAVDFYQIGQPLPSLPEIVAGQNPSVSEVYPQVNFRSGNPGRGQATDENFSGFVVDFVMEVNGYLNVSESKVYDLQFIANNGGKLTIDGETIMEGHYYEGTYVDDKEIYLTEGAHQIKIDFYHHLFGKSLILGWRQNKSEQYAPIPASAFTHNPFDIKPTSSGIKEILRSNAPGFGASLDKVHPSFDLSAVRPVGFEPRVGDIEFMEDGRLVVCTWDGEVFVLDNVTNGDPDGVKVTRIADGLCEPLGITVLGGDIYVLQRWELTKLVDHDGDGITDEYLSIADTWGTRANFHEWSFGLLYRKGFFYCNLGIALGRNTHDQSVDRGKALKIAMDGTYSHIAYGLKEANGIGFGPDGEIFATDNEGEYNPVCKVIHLPLEGKPFFGNRSIERDSLPDDLVEKPPVIWLPQNEIANSPSQPAIMHHGPYEGQMLHGEITHGGIKRDFVEKVNGEYQGAVFRFSQGLEVGINRLEWGPDGALYASGLGGDQDFGHQGHYFGLQRLTYNGHPAFEMLAIRAKSNGLEIEFTKPLRTGDGTMPDDYKIQQWYFIWTKEISSQEKRDLENLEVVSVSPSDDRKRVFLELAGMKAGHVLYVQLQPTFLSADNEQLWSNEGWYTLNAIPDEPGRVQAYPHLRKSNALTSPERDDGWTLLFDGNSAGGWQTKQTSGWKVGNGHLQGEGQSTVLATQQSFDNFELELEWKLATGAEGGILYKVPDENDFENALVFSPRMQLVDDRGNPEAKAVRKHQTGAVYDVLEPRYSVSKPANEYNLARLVLNDDYVEHWVNGIKVIEYQLGSEEWKQQLSGTIYAGHVDYGQVSGGRIALYSRQGNIWIRNIRVREL